MIANIDNVVALPDRLPKYGDAQIPVGDYDARILGYETWARFRGWTPRVVVAWSICSMGYVGITIPAYYAVKSLIGNPKRNGRYRIGTRSRLYRDLGRMVLTRPPLDYIPLEILANELYSVTVRDVTKDQYQLDLDAVRYSVVDHVNGRAQR